MLCVLHSLFTGFASTCFSTASLKIGIEKNKEMTKTQKEQTKEENEEGKDIQQIHGGESLHLQMKLQSKL